MAPKHDILYMRFDTDGNLAMKPQRPKPFGNTLHFPLLEQERKATVIHWDPVAIFGMVTAVALLVAMVVGFVVLQQARQDNQMLADYVQQVKTENRQLEILYSESYDLENVQQQALSMGMIPASDATSRHIQMEIGKDSDQKVNLVEQVYAFLTGPFA